VLHVCFGVAGMVAAWTDVAYVQAVSTVVPAAVVPFASLVLLLLGAMCKQCVCTKDVGDVEPSQPSQPSQPGGHASAGLTLSYEDYLRLRSFCGTRESFYDLITSASLQASQSGEAPEILPPNLSQLVGLPAESDPNPM